MITGSLTSAFAPHYELERELGRGGMATVYLGRDLRHERFVAIKVLHPTIAAAVGTERFLREIRIAAHLQHPHILPVFDSGECAGRLWYAMPYVEGESLRDRLRREGPLPLGTALRVARHVAEALDYAHRHGVVHRDIKPENILLADGQAVVADFGIARPIDTGDETGITLTGIVIGTPAYVSPEQGAGSTRLDGRSDLYSLGCVLFEMLVGEPLFTGRTPHAVIEQRFLDPSPLLERIPSAVPAHVIAALARLLAQHREERFESGARLAAALADERMASQGTTPVEVSGPAPSVRRSARPVAAPEAPAPGMPGSTGRRRIRVPMAMMLLGLGFLIGVGVLFGWLQSHADQREVGPKRLAVLPFDNLGDSADAYFADGVTDAVRGKLAGVPGLQVIASASADEYKHTRKSPRLIARELGVTYLLVGKIRWQKAGGRVNRVEVSPELIELTDNGEATTRWQQPFDASLTDVFQVQADIAGRVTEALDVALGRSQRETLGEPLTRNVAAYDAYLKGEELLKSGVDIATLGRAVAEYEEAVTLDSTFVAAWAQLSRAHSYLYGAGQIRASEAAQSRAAAERALALAPNRFEGHLALGDYYSYIQGDNVRASEQYALAQRTAPNNAQVLAAAGASEEGLGRWDAAVGHFRRALTLDPRAARTAIGLARALLWLRRYPEALQAEEHALALTPASLAALEDRAMIYLAQGDLAGARNMLRAAPREVQPAALIGFVAQTCDLYWVLDEGQQRLLLGLTPEAFDGNRGTWGLALAGTYALRG
ncbi:MAG TPA: protein kinase, partial [Gemmatimonadales bacterium]|nr:protein kinase [Gemmatimonadales bacterium]